MFGTLIILVAALQAWTIPYYALTPGDATPVAPLVLISGLKTDTQHDKIMLTDVYLQSLTAWQYVLMHFQDHVEFVSTGQLVDPGIPTDELDAQSYLQMSDSKEAAEVAALRALGWTIPAEATGAVINGVIAPSPARSAGLHVADEVVGVNSRPVHTSCDLISVVHSLAPDVVVHLLVRRAAIDAKGVISWSTPRAMSMRTAPTPVGFTSSGCAGVSGGDRSWLGLSLEDGVHYALPGVFSIDTNYIGGPSAGLAMTLTLIDKLSAGSLTGHRVVAATGTIDATGNVGDVGGVAEKTIAVERAGATVFIVPRDELGVARGAASPGLRILGVTTLAQALSDLRALGGSAPVALTKPH